MPSSKPEEKEVTLPDGTVVDPVEKPNDVEGHKLAQPPSGVVNERDLPGNEPFAGDDTIVREHMPSEQNVIPTVTGPVPVIESDQDKMAHRPGDDIGVVGPRLIPNDQSKNVHQPGDGRTVASHRPRTKDTVDQQPPENAKKCPNCGADLVEHDDPGGAKEGARHCNECGGCWAPGLRHLRAGHPSPAGWEGG